jgi:hypothetical protein
MCDTMNLLDGITRGISISISEVVVPPHGHWFLRKASVNTPTQAITTA